MLNSKTVTGGPHQKEEFGKCSACLCNRRIILVSVVECEYNPSLIAAVLKVIVTFLGSVRLMFGFVTVQVWQEAGKKEIVEESKNILRYN